MTRPRSARPLLGLVVGALLTTGCLPQVATEQGREVAWLYDIFMVAAAIVFVLIVGLMAWAIVRYRGEAGRDVRPPPARHGNLALEVTWWAVPTLIVVVLIGLTWSVLSQVDAREDAPALSVGVEGFQWGWRFTYEDAGVVVSGTAQDPPTLYLPTTRTIAFVITSEDVVHSFSIPNFLIKRDALPSRENRFDVVIDREGTYGGQCGEFCGLLHARQLFTIEAVPPEEFDDWLGAQETTE